MLREYDNMKEAIKNPKITNKMVDIIKEILISEKKFTDTNYERL